jgi:hypothetical protein
VGGPSVNYVGAPVPYLTLDELRRSPISLSLRDLVPGSSGADQDAELSRMILRASAMINSACNQNLAAAVTTESGQVAVSDFGELRLHTRCSPVIEVLAVAVGWDSSHTSPVTDLSGAVLDPWRITLRGPSPLFSSCRGGQRLYAEWTYCSGYPIATLASPVSAGDTVLTVTNTIGVLPGQTVLTVEDGPWLETVVPTAVSAGTLTVAPLTYAHQVGVGVSAVPDDVKEALLVMMSYLRDSYSVAMGAIDPNGARPGERGVLCDVATMLHDYRRVW